MSEVLKVSSKSIPNAVAGALAAVVRQHGEGEIQVVGAGALNQAVKAIAIARGFLTESGVDLVCIPLFAEVEIDGEERTAIRLSCQDRAATPPAADHGAERSALPYTVDLRMLERDGAAAAAGGARAHRP